MTRLERFYYWAVSIASIVAAVAGIVTAVVVVSSLRGAFRQLENQILSAHVQDWQSPEMMSARTIVSHSDQTTLQDIFTARHAPELKNSCFRIGHFFELLGLQVERKYISFDAAYQMFGSPAVTYWERLEPSIRAFRQHDRDETYFEWFEKFATRCAYEAACGKR